MKIHPDDFHGFANARRQDHEAFVTARGTPFPRYESGIKHRTSLRLTYLCHKQTIEIHSDDLQMNRDRWRKIRAEIEQDIMDGVLPPGSKLPTEPELVTAYQAGRHSVRRAITELGKEGLLSVEQGRGTFVQPRPVLEYNIGARTRLRSNFASQGIDVSSENLGSEHLPARRSIAADLQIDLGAEVVASSRMTLADGVPISFGTLYHNADRFSEFPARRAALGSVSAVYKSYGIDDYLRGATQMNARPARANEAQRLRQHPDMPVIVIRAVDTLLDGTPIACSRVIWSAARVKFNIPHRED